jgi:hypothetical protein
MKRKSKKSAIAMMAALSTAIFLMHITASMNNRSVAWGDLDNKPEPIKSYSCRIIGMETDPNAVTQCYVSLEHGMRTDTFSNGKLTMRYYSLLEKELSLVIMPESKQYTRILLGEEQLESTRLKFDPKDMIRQVLLTEYTELGRDTINGIEVESIETTDPKYLGGIYDKIHIRLWVNTETQLPVRMETQTQQKWKEKTKVMSSVTDDFKWNVVFESDFFEPHIPDNYTLTAEIPKPATPNETDAIQGLKRFAKIANGKYPTDLDINTIVKERKNILSKTPYIPEPSPPTDLPTQEELEAELKTLKDYRGNFQEYKKEVEKYKKKLAKYSKVKQAWLPEWNNAMKDKESMGELITLNRPAIFYRYLTEQKKNPAYYGNKVTAKDSNLVLMRWKITDSQYRVIFGDLTAKDVSIEKLAELEKELLK